MLIPALQFENENNTSFATIRYLCQHTFFKLQKIKKNKNKTLSTFIKGK